MNLFLPPARMSRLQIEITTACNLKCAGCQRTIGLAKGAWTNRHMSKATFAAVLKNTPPAEIIILQGIGEPTLHPDLPELVALARNRDGVRAVSFNTNALFCGLDDYRKLQERGLNHVSVSVDSLDPAVAESVRSGTDVALLQERIQGLIRMGLGLTVSIVISRRTLGGLAGLVETLVRLGVKVVETQPLIGYGRPDQNTAMLDAEELRQAAAAVAAIAASHPKLTVLPAPSFTPNGSRCRRPFHSGYVTVEGFITPCCVTNDVEQFGRTDVLFQDFASAWSRPGVAGWFQNFLDREPEICRGCSYNPSGAFNASLPAPPPPDAPHETKTPAALAEDLHARGVLAHQNGQPKLALPLLRAAVALAPIAHYRNNLGVILGLAGQLEEARAELEATLAEHPEYPYAYLSLAAVFEQQKRPQDAAAILLRMARGALQSRSAPLTKQALDRLLAQAEPNDGLAEFAHQLRLAGDADNAQRVFNRLIQARPNDPGLLLCLAIAKLPVIYNSPEHAAACRDAYIAAMAAFRDHVERASPEQRAAAAYHVGMAKPFILSYQGFDDVALQRDYGASVSRLTHARYPAWATPRPVLEGPPWRVGFATAYWNLHSVSKLFGGWVRFLDRSRFQVYGYDFNNAPLDAWGKPLSEACDVFRPQIPTGETTEAWARTIAADRLHALIYLEIGMHPTAVRMATLRLAPVQAMTWGHPVTSGFPEMDLFLSSDFMEPPDGQNHYTEKLVRLPGLSICYLPLPPGAGDLTRAEVGLREDSVAFICCQSLFKYRPIDDDVLPRIAAATPNAQFLFIGDPGQWTTRAFRARLEKAFVTAGIDPTRHLAFTTPTPVPKFPALLRLGDVYLDSLTWSGGNTSLEAATVGLPMTTMAGGLMRGRHTTGILRALGLEELIADSKDAYVRIAARLGNDAAYRRTMAARTAAAQASLFGDMTPVRALEAVLEQEIMNRAASPH